MENSVPISELESRLMTIDEGARILRIKPATIHNWLSKKRLNPIKLCGKTYLDRLQVETLIRSAFN